MLLMIILLRAFIWQQNPTLCVVSCGTVHSPDFPISGTVHLSGKFPIKVLGIVYEVNFGLVRDIRIIRLACNFKTPFHILSDGGG